MTTQRSRGSRPLGRPAVPCATSRQPTPKPERSRQRQGAPAGGLVCRDRSGAASRRSTTRPRSAADAPPPACTRPPQRCPQPWLLGVVDRATGDGTGPHATRLDPVMTAAPPYRGLPHHQHPADAGRDGCDRADGRTPDGWTPDGLDTSRPDSRVRTREPDTRTLDGLDTSRLDTWTPGRRAGLGGHPVVDTDRRWAAGRHPGIPTTATRTPPTGMLSRSSAGQTPRGPIRNQDSSAVEDPAGSWPPPRQTAVGDPPPSGRRLGALLSCVGVGGYEERATGQRKVRCAGSGWCGVLMRV
jgi:hypothetical protein